MFPAQDEFEVQQKFIQQTACELVQRMWGAVPQADVDYVSSYDAYFPGDYTAHILRVPYSYCIFKTGL